jgi:hypothetical protein
LLNSKLIGVNGDVTINASSLIHINLSGAYYYDFLIKKFEYVEAVMFDTPIFKEDEWSSISSISISINHEHNINKRMNLRDQRIKYFLDYLGSCEKESIEKSKIQSLGIHEEISRSLLSQTSDIINKLTFYSKKK